MVKQAGFTLTGMAMMPPQIVKLAMPVSPYPTFPRSREKGQTHRFAGFTLIELMVTVAIIGLLATIAFPMAEVAVQRSKEQDLRQELRQIREAIDAYKQVWDEKRIERTLGESGYPPKLNVLVEGVKDNTSPTEKYIYFLRSLPRDPMSNDDQATPEETWGKRSYASPPDDPQEGDDVFDVYSLNEDKGLNGIPYREW